MTSLRKPFAVVDVFAARPLAGNPLAVVPDADDLDEETMRGIAREFNQSETTFVLAPSSSQAQARLRSFTPTGAEVFGAGHNSLGAWWWLASTGRLEVTGPRSMFGQEIGDVVLQVEVVFDGSQLKEIGLRQSSGEFKREASELAELAVALGLAPEHLGPESAQVVSTGAPHLLVPTRTRTAVESAAPDAPRLAAALRAVGGEGCYLYCLDPIEDGSTAHARFFNPTVGIWEDPATGSAAGPLACQLVRRGQASEKAPIIIEQGHAVGRPSRVQVIVDGDNVTLFGACVVAAEGQLILGPQSPSPRRQGARPTAKAG
jgi:trans-2,3-dihydro-3-hydroxyanthranilate isomerase